MKLIKNNYNNNYFNNNNNQKSHFGQFSATLNLQVKYRLNVLLKLTFFHWVCAPGHELSIEMHNTSICCFWNAQQREKCAPFSYGQIWVFIIIFSKLLVRLFSKFACSNYFLLRIFWKYRRRNRSMIKIFEKFSKFSQNFSVLRFCRRYFQKMRNRKQFRHASFQNNQTSSLKIIIIKTHVLTRKNAAKFSRCGALLKNRRAMFSISIESWRPETHS